MTVACPFGIVNRPIEDVLTVMLLDVIVAKVAWRNDSLICGAVTETESPIFAPMNESSATMEIVPATSAIKICFFMMHVRLLSAALSDNRQPYPR